MYIMYIIVGFASVGTAPSDRAQSGACKRVEELMRLNRVLLVGLLLSSISTPSLSHANEFPSKPVRIIGWAAGAFSDTIHRLMAKHLEVLWKQPVIVINRPGAGGILAAEEGAKSPADGHTIVWGEPVGWALIREFQSTDKAQFPVDRLTPVSLIVDAPSVIAVDPKLPIHDFKDFLSYARATKNPLTYGSPGVLSVLHISIELLSHKTGLKFTHVPYKSILDAANAVANGELAFGLASSSTFREMARTGRVRLIAVTSEQRFSQYPDIPTISEQVPGYAITTKAGFYMHRDTPASILERVSRDLAEATRAGNVSELITSAGSIPVGSTPAEYRLSGKQDIDLLMPIAQEITAREYNKPK